MSALSNALTRTAWNAIGGNENAVDAVSFGGAGGLPSAYPVTDFASAAIATAALSIIELLRKRSGQPPSATVDSWFRFGHTPHLVAGTHRRLPERLRMVRSMGSAPGIRQLGANEHGDRGRRYVVAQRTSARAASGSGARSRDRLSHGGGGDPRRDSAPGAGKWRRGAPFAGTNGEAACRAG